MKMIKREATPFVGGSSLIVIFAVLCLVTFAVLTLATARSAGRLSEVSAASVTAYYDADSRAEAIFAAIRRGEMPEGVSVSEDGVCSYECEISPTQLLCVEVKSENGEWRVLRWQSVSTVR